MRKIESQKKQFTCADAATVAITFKSASFSPEFLLKKKARYFKYMSYTWKAKLNAAKKTRGLPSKWVGVELLCSSNAVCRHNHKKSVITWHTSVCLAKVVYLFVNPVLLHGQRLQQNHRRLIDYLDEVLRWRKKDPWLPSTWIGARSPSSRISPDELLRHHQTWR